MCQSDKDTPLHSFTFQKIKKIPICQSERQAQSCEVQWAFQGIKTPMGVATYDNIRLQEIESQLPSEEAIQKRLEQAEEYISKLKEKNK